MKYYLILVFAITILFILYVTSLPLRLFPNSDIAARLSGKSKLYYYAHNDEVFSLDDGKVIYFKQGIFHRSSTGLKAFPDGGLGWDSGSRYDIFGIQDNNILWQRSYNIYSRPFFDMNRHLIDGAIVEDIDKEQDPFQDFVGGWNVSPRKVYKCSDDKYQFWSLIDKNGKDVTTAIEVSFNSGSIKSINQFPSPGCIDISYDVNEFPTCPESEQWLEKYPNGNKDSIFISKCLNKILP